MSGQLEPIVDWIGNWPISHGERDDLDPDNPEACLCGVPNYLLCDGPGIYTATVHADGHLSDGNGFAP
jgi:hypothetical protein